MHAHGDRDPGLSISKGRDGRVLLHCYVGCDTADILWAANLAWADLFSISGPPLTAEQRAVIERDHEQREWARLRLHWLHAQGCDRLHELEGLVDTLAARLMHMAESDESRKLTTQFHQTLDETCRLESVLIRIERWF
jgi:hypothetical protein